MTELKFTELFIEASKTASGGRSYLPGEIIEIWEQFVGFCADGYHDNIYEYYNDLQIRDTLESILTDDRLRACSEMSWVRKQVEEVDAHFRSLLQEQEIQGLTAQTWWCRYPPKYAEAILASDFLHKYGVHVEVVGS